MTDDTRLWHVTVTLAGAPMEPLIVRGALQRLTELRPFMSSIRFGPDRAELKYWDEADSLADLIDTPDKRPVTAPEGDNRADWQPKTAAEMFSEE